MGKRFEGRNVIVTGAAEGIGHATAAKFAMEGANVVLIDLNNRGLQTAKEELSVFGTDIQTFCSDVANEQIAKEIVADTIARLGKIDILVNNAGVWRRDIAFVDTTSDMWKKYFDINVFGTFYYTHAVLPNMLEHGWGRIINVGSVAGVYGKSNMADYSASKGAVIAFSYALAKEVTDKGILVNCVSPGMVSWEYDNPHLLTDINYIGRMGTHTEIANMICFLASEEASYISGQNIQVDGCRKII